MRRTVLITAVLVGATAVAVAGVTYLTVQAQRERETRLAAIDTAEEFVAAWQDGDWQRLDVLAGGEPSGAGAAHAAASERLRVREAAIALTEVDVDTAVEGRASADYRATFQLAGLGEWSYDGRFLLSGTDSAWTVDWSPSTLHPGLAEDRRLDRVRRWPPRAPVLDRHGRDLAEGPFSGLLGSVGEVTADQLDALGEPYEAGDAAGRSGLQQSLERRLAGTPGGEVRIVETDSGEVVQVLHEVAVGQPPAVRTTLDPRVQLAGQAALTPIAQPAALVAVDVASGELRAVVNTPADGFNRALSGRYPPGSTFKAVTTAALLAHGLDTADTVDCPATATIGGRRFRNAGFAELGPLSFRDAFAESCNTAFVAQADLLPEGALAAAATQFGFNVGVDIGVPTADARFPEPVDAVEHAAAAIGQGRVEATPLHMASVAAAVARGRWQAPTLLLGESRDEPAAGEPLSPQVTAQLADLMRHVVAAGTGTAAQVTGEPVAGKTGTAEFGTGPATHAWFLAFRGELAVAVLVEGGGFGGEVAAPAAARFYTPLG